jgi:ABC-type uncharacterized transport system involved in gliding motility auxiliary subunit
MAGAAALFLGLALWLIGGSLELLNEIALALGVVLLAVYVLLEPAQVRGAMTGRTARYGGNALVMALAFIGILVMVNFLSNRHYKRFDLTATKQFSLSEQTEQILKTLSRPVKITAFLSSQYSTGNLPDLLKEYAARTNKVTYEVIDPDLKPAVARQYNITSYNSVVYESGDKTHMSFGTEERDITGAILKVTSDTTKTVYFLTGHGERQIGDYGENGLAQLKTALEGDNYVVKPLNLAISGTVPADCSVLVVARPTQKLLEQEQSEISGWILQAGRAMILQEPTVETGLNDLLAAFMVQYADDIVVDPASALMGDVGSPVVQQYPYNTITKDLPATLFPLARSIEIQQDPAGALQGFSASPLVQSTAQGWGETDLKQTRVSYSEGLDLKGPRNIAVTVELIAPLSPEAAKLKTSDKTRLAVFGDSDFLANSYINSLGNKDLAVNTINWLMEDETLISIREKAQQNNELVLTAAQSRTVMYSSTVFLPLLVLAIGAMVWWRRR